MVPDIQRDSQQQQRVPASEMRMLNSGVSASNVLGNGNNSGDIGVGITRLNNNQITIKHDGFSVVASESQTIVQRLEELNAKCMALTDNRQALAWDCEELERCPTARQTVMQLLAHQQQINRNLIALGTRNYLMGIYNFGRGRQQQMAQRRSAAQIQQLSQQLSQCYAQLSDSQRATKRLQVVQAALVRTNSLFASVAAQHRRQLVGHAHALSHLSHLAQRERHAAKRAALVATAATIIAAITVAAWLQRSLFSFSFALSRPRSLHSSLPLSVPAVLRRWISRTATIVVAATVILRMRLRSWFWLLRLLYRFAILRSLLIYPTGLISPCSDASDAA